MSPKQRSRRSPWQGLKVLVTAGPTREPLDPVRFLSNASSGKTGYALAAAAQKRGARVTLVSGPTALEAPKGVLRVSVTTAREMLTASLKALPGTRLVIGAAAVGDFQPAAAARVKIKKVPGRGLTLALVPTPDVIATLARHKKKGRPIVVGFALETNRLLANAKEKLVKKNLDLIVANNPDALHREDTRAILLSPSGWTSPYEGPKAGLADKVLDAVETLI